MPGLGGGGGGLALVLREDARPEDVLTGVLQVHPAACSHQECCFRYLMTERAVCLDLGAAICLLDRHVVPS